MRKLVLLISILFCLIPVMVKANSGPPVAGIDVITIRDTYDTENNFIPKGTKLHFWSQGYGDGEVYGHVDGDYDSVKMSDVMLVNAEYEGEIYEDNSYHSVYVFDKGVYLYKGPSKLYAKVSAEIPVGTIITSNKSYSSGHDIWLYVEYNGINGWLYIFNEDNTLYEGSSNVAEVKSGAVITAKKITEIYEIPNENANKISVSISENTVLNYDYYKSDFGSGEPPCFIDFWFHVNISGVDGWIHTADGEVASKAKIKAIAIKKEGFDLYKVYGDETSKVHKRLEANEEFTIEYVFGNSGYYITYQNENYWIKSLVDSSSPDFDEDFWCRVDFDYVPLVSNNSNPYYKASKKTNIYLYPDKTSSILKSVDVDTILLVKYEGTDWVYVISSNIKGWILKDDLTYYVSNEKEEPEKTNQGEKNEEQKVEDVKEPPLPIIDYEKDKISKTPVKMILIACALATVVLFVVALTAIIIFNKKKDSNNGV